jgi:hypothetical protein
MSQAAILLATIFCAYDFSLKAWCHCRNAIPAIDVCGAFYIRYTEFLISFDRPDEQFARA